MKNAFRKGRGRERAEVVVIVFLVLNLFYSLLRGSNGFITEKTILFQGSRGAQLFPGDPPFSREVQMLISIESHIACDFPGGVQTPTPLDPLMRISGGMFHLILYVPSTIFTYKGTGLPGMNQY